MSRPHRRPVNGPGRLPPDVRCTLAPTPHETATVSPTQQRTPDGQPALVLESYEGTNFKKPASRTVTLKEGKTEELKFELEPK